MQSSRPFKLFLVASILAVVGPVLALSQNKTTKADTTSSQSTRKILEARSPRPPLRISIAEKALNAQFNGSMTQELPTKNTSKSLRGGTGADGGGGNPQLIKEASIRLLLLGGGLKNAMLNYLKTLPLEKIENLEVRSTLFNLVKNNELQNDILVPENYVEEDACRDSFDADVPAATRIGDRGGKICFDIKKLARDYKDLNEEEIMIRLASLAFHEHIHHFQNTSIDLKSNENQAYQVAAYVSLTAKTFEIPLLKWSAPVNMDPCPDLTGRYGINDPDDPHTPWKHTVAVTQKTKNSVTTYWINTEDFGPQAITEMMADGREHSITLPGSVLQSSITVCKNNKVIKISRGKVPNEAWDLTTYEVFELDEKGNLKGIYKSYVANTEQPMPGTVEGSKPMIWKRIK